MKKTKSFCYERTAKQRKGRRKWSTGKLTKRRGSEFLRFLEAGTRYSEKWSE